MMTPVIEVSRCTGCGACVEACRFDAITLVENCAVVDAARCRGCGTCMEVCPAGAIRIEAVKTTKGLFRLNIKQADTITKGVRTMPGFNGTGPRGMGAMTGGGRGYCNPRGMGMGYGNRQYGGRRFFYQPTAPAPVVTREQELQALRSQAEMLQQDMADIQSRISELEKDEK